MVYKFGSAVFRIDRNSNWVDNAQFVCVVLEQVATRYRRWNGLNVKNCDRVLKMKMQITQLLQRPAHDHA